MKKVAYVVGCLLIVSFALLAVYMQWMHSTYIDRTLRAYTGIKSYEVTSKEHSDYDWYAEVRIQEEDGARLLQRYPFQTGFSKAVLARKLANPYANDCPTCWYYLDDKDYGPYDYRLFLLSADKKQLMVYELFGN